jgi:hypothetical protein
MRANLVKGDADLERKLMLDEWVYGTGLPANVARPAPEAFAEVDAAAADYAKSRSVDPAPWTRWTTAERLRFLAKLPPQMDAKQLAALDNGLDLSKSGNDEILFAWLDRALANRYQPAVPLAEQFLARVGRRKFVQPLFQTLMDQGDWGRPIARRIYAKTRAGYHAVTQNSVDAVVNPA